MGINLPGAVLELLSVLRGRPDALVPFADVQKALKLSHMEDRGLQDVPLDAITGSLNRTQDFDQTFLPRSDALNERLRQLRELADGPAGYPPVQLYKVGQAYFVVDGHHRIAVARALGARTIEAWVLEFPTEVDVEPGDALPDVLTKAAERNFAATTGLPTSGDDGICMTIPAGYDRLLEHIAVHQYFLGLQHERPFSWREAVDSWRDTVYRPIVRVIREHDLLSAFPGRCEGDLYLWTVDRLHHLRQQYGESVPPDAAVPAVSRWRRLLARVRRRFAAGS